MRLENLFKPEVLKTIVFKIYQNFLTPNKALSNIFKMGISKYLNTYMYFKFYKTIKKKLESFLDLSLL